LAKIPVFFIPNNPLTKSEFFQSMKKAKDLIIEGRVKKTESGACECMTEAFEIVTNLLTQVHPMRHVIQGFIWLFVTIVAVIISVVITKWLS
jgi:hypothetical protein